MERAVSWVDASKTGFRPTLIADANVQERQFLLELLDCNMAASKPPIALRIAPQAHQTTHESQRQLFLQKWQRQNQVP